MVLVYLISTGKKPTKSIPGYFEFVILVKFLLMFHFAFSFFSQPRAPVYKKFY